MSRKPSGVETLAKLIDECQTAYVRLSMNERKARWPGDDPGNWSPMSWQEQRAIAELLLERGVYLP